MKIEILKLFIQASISIVAAFLAAWLSVRRFRDEKWWERKASAYSELIDALHKMKWRLSETYDAILEQRELSKEYSNELLHEFKLARQNVWRIADSSSFLVSPEVFKAAEEMEKGLSSAQIAESWFEHIDEQFAAVNKCLKQVKSIGTKELGIKTKDLQ